MSKKDYVIIDKTNVTFWPGRLPFRNMDSTTGYPTREAAWKRMREVIRHYNANYGQSPGHLSVVERHHKVNKGRKA